MANIQVNHKQCLTLDVFTVAKKDIIQCMLFLTRNLCLHTLSQQSHLQQLLLITKQNLYITFIGCVQENQQAKIKSVINNSTIATCQPTLYFLIAIIFFILLCILYHQ